ncbi:MAG: PHP domain-containing protein [Methanobrevibacter sp.]|nr:PHP domain-containing protein [Methanobrevibacter sp.]
MKLDPHIHSIYSGDAISEPQDIIKQAIAIGLDIIAISDHDTVKGSTLAIDIAKDMNDILVVPSIEITTNKGHILGFGLETLISPGLSPEETVEKIHDEGGIAIVPHPFSPYRRGLFFKNKKIMNRLTDFNYSEDFNENNNKKNSNDDNNIKNSYKNIRIEGVEVLNARYIFGYSNYKANKLAQKKDLAKIGASDSHFLEAIGNCYTELTDIDTEPSVDDVIEAIKSKKTIAKGSRTSNKLIAKEVINKKIRRIYY